MKRKNKKSWKRIAKALTSASDHNNMYKSNKHRDLTIRLLTEVVRSLKQIRSHEIILGK